MTEYATFFRYLHLTLAITILLGLHAGPGRAELLEKVVAVVNGEVITQTELEAEGRKLFLQLRQSTPAAELDNTLAAARRQVLSNLIDDLLISQKAKELRVDVTEAELDSAIAKISTDNNMTEAELLAELARSGRSLVEYRRKLADQIRHSKLVSYEVRSKIVISEEKAREYYATVYAQRQTPPGYHLLQIGLTWGTPESAADTQAKARQKAAGLRKLAVAGQDFRELARSFSELPSAKDGGDLGFFTEDEMAAEVRAVIVGLEPGRISEVIATPNSYQFYLVLARNLNGAPEFPPFAESSAEIFELLRQEELATRYKKWLAEIKEQAIIKELL
jgi:peptidyl-prolyl cis-trans isomerase SurA